MNNIKVFKIELNVAYNDDNVDENVISDNLWETFKSLHNGIVMLNIMDIKQIKSKSAIIKYLKNMKDVTVENAPEIKKEKKSKKKNENKK